MSTTPGIKLICTHEGCTEKSVARRLCHKHYQAAWKAGELGQHVPLPPRRKHRTVCPPDHKHADSTTCYIQHQCRCTPCIEHHNQMNQSRTRMKAYGRFDTGLVDAEAVREHILMLGEYGIGYKRVAELAGVGVTGVRTLIWGRQDPGPRFGEIPKRVAREKAEAILAVEASIENLGDGAKLPATGTHRRIQALVTRGWSLTKLAARLDMQVGNFWKILERDQVIASTHRRMAEVYDELWDKQPPHDEWHSKAAFSRTLNYAKRRGWLPPLAWDDIDTDPEPERDVVSQGRATAEEVLDDVEFLLDAGESPEQVATIIGRKVPALAKLAERNGRRELANMFGSLDKRMAAA
jgi:hypothetical protein